MSKCSPMGYTSYPPHEIEKTRAKMRDAVFRAQYLLGRASSQPQVAASSAQVPVIPPQSMLEPPPPPDPGMPEAYMFQDPSYNPQSRSRTRSMSRPPPLLIPPQAPPVSALQMPVPQMSALPPASSRPPSALVASTHYRMSRSRSQSFSAAHAPRPMSTSVLHPPVPAQAIPFAMYAVPASTVSSRPPSVHSVASSRASIISFQGLPPNFIPTSFIPNSYHVRAPPRLTVTAC